MTQIKNNINTYADLTAFNADLNKDFPNISYIEGTDEVKWVKDDPTLIIATYRILNTNNQITLFDSRKNAQFSKMWIDGIEQPEVVYQYKFNTIGEHTIKYKLSDSTKIEEVTFSNLSSSAGFPITFVLPVTLTSIGDDCFNYSSNLTSIICMATTPPTLGDSAFKNTNNCPIYVPTESVNTYKTAENWSTYASRIQAIPTT